LDPLFMKHGLQLQLLAYLSVLRKLPQAAQMFGYEALIPAGVFYVNLRGDYKGGSREEVLGATENWQAAYKHTGRFDAAVLPHLDNRAAKLGTQFSYRVNNDGSLDRRSEAMDQAAFGQLLDNVEAHLVRMGQEIYRGAIRPNPFQKSGERACDNCEYQGICRIDSWTHEFRNLQ
jgi:ATP-dependent helicase/nuclease subunit B